MKLIFKVLSIVSMISFISCISMQKTTSVQHQNYEQQKNDGKFVHTVFFWFGDNVTPQDEQTFVNGLENLRGIKTVGSLSIGKPAMTPREVVDNSYDYALIIRFANKEDQDYYQDAPLHLKFIEDSQHVWERVQVYDTLVE